MDAVDLNTINFTLQYARGISKVEKKGKKEQTVSYALPGRKALKIKSPEIKNFTTGIVMVEIFVDRDGNVIHARVVPDKSIIYNKAIVTNAEQAAQESKFSADPDAPKKTKGYFTYRFIKVGSE